MTVLVDDSVWVHHFQFGEDALEALLGKGAVQQHPVVLGELALIELPKRDEVLSLLSELPSATVATEEEVRLFVDEQQLFGMNLCWEEAHLLASARLSGAELWTRKERLLRAAERAEVKTYGGPEEVDQRERRKRAEERRRTWTRGGKFSSFEEMENFAIDEELDSTPEDRLRLAFWLSGQLFPDKLPPRKKWPVEVRRFDDPDRWMRQ